MQIMESQCSGPSDSDGDIIRCVQRACGGRPWCFRAAERRTVECRELSQQAGASRGKKGRASQAIGHVNNTFYILWPAVS